MRTSLKFAINAMLVNTFLTNLHVTIPSADFTVMKLMKLLQFTLTQCIGKNVVKATYLPIELLL